ncbi:GNAT family N-acetyltransferase, partial [Planktotalea arctica]|uniref:GNAT family N-acetyltransferase n=1 Tax=Planktotalea arctica TaxID=1481893 RepID=UPI00321ABD14
PALDLIQAQAAASSGRVEVIVNTSDMAGLMAKADLAIGAAGGTSWERCALGLPTLVAVLADNQAEAAVALSSAGAAIEIGSPQSSEFPAKLAVALKRTQVSANLKAFSQSAASVTDGRGVTRVADALECPLALRRATMDDAEAIWHWRRALPVSYFRTQSTPSLREHLSWFLGALGDARRRLYVAGDPSIAHLRLDLDDTEHGAVSIILAPEARGKGLGLRLLSLLASSGRAAGLSALVAEVHPENTASIALFRAGGYAEKGLVDGFYGFKLAL